jgi:hypothetical protein
MLARDGSEVCDACRLIVYGGVYVSAMPVRDIQSVVIRYAMQCEMSSVQSPVPFIA